MATAGFLQEYRIAEFMGSVTQGIQGTVRGVQNVGGGKGAQQLEMARAGLMHTGKNGIDDPQRRRRSDAAGGGALTRRKHATVAARRMFEGAHNRGADRNDASALRSRLPDRGHGCGRDGIGLVQGKPGIERLISRG